MTVWYNPADNFVMALYDDAESASTVWSDAGYLKATVGDKGLKNLLKLYGRDATVTVVRGTVTGVVSNTNPVQPALSAEEAEIQTILSKIGDESAKFGDLLRLAKLERRL